MLQKEVPRELIPIQSSAEFGMYTNRRFGSAVKELNAKAYNEIIRKWKIDHKRRRNLWKAVKEAGLSF